MPTQESFKRTDGAHQSYYLGACHAITSGRAGTQDGKTFVSFKEGDVESLSMCIVMMQECDSSTKYEKRCIQLVELETAVATDEEYMTRAFQTTDVKELFSRHYRPDLVLMQSLGTANANNCRMETGTLDIGGKEVPVDWDFVNRFPPAAAERDWQWYPAIAINLKGKCRLYQRYKNQRWLLCKRQMEELGGDRSNRKWNLRFFEVWHVSGTGNGQRRGGVLEAGSHGTGEGTPGRVSSGGGTGCDGDAVVRLGDARGRRRLKRRCVVGALLHVGVDV